MIFLKSSCAYVKNTTFSTRSQALFRIFRHLRPSEPLHSHPLAPRRQTGSIGDLLIQSGEVIDPELTVHTKLIVTGCLCCNCGILFAPDPALNAPHDLRCLIERVRIMQQKSAYDIKTPERSLP